MCIHVQLRGASSTYPSSCIIVDLSHEGALSSLLGCTVVRLSTSMHQVQGTEHRFFNNEGVLAAIDAAYQLVKAPFILLTSEDMIFRARGRFLHEVMIIAFELSSATVLLSHTDHMFFDRIVVCMPCISFEWDQC
jgi:hypothetical protein